MGRALHQLHLAGPIPDGGQGKTGFEGLACFHQFLQRLGGAQAGVGFAGIHQHQVAGFWQHIQAAFQLLSQFRRALVAKGAALQDHHPGPRSQGGCAGFREGLGCLAGVVAIEPAEVDAAPGRIDQLVDQGLDGPAAGGLIVAPIEVEGHGVRGA